MHNNLGLLMEVLKEEELVLSKLWVVIPILIKADGWKERLPTHVVWILARMLFIFENLTYFMHCQSGVWHCRPKSCYKNDWCLNLFYA